ncbi:LexA family transcriptional regulator [Sinirhodobacter populi]|uniref:LexA family transcriptional regulator n=1 Tax=Paenirhodobacter populi TaxID=2306993 RepID=A0A443J1K1_9RHOB|nr:LexA family transcriptional regulator [Sinirhodobacter populi]
MEPKTPLGKRLRAVRTQVGIEDRDSFAEQSGISKSTIAHYERGDRTPDATMLERYRDRWGVDLNWLITGKGEMFQSQGESGQSQSMALTNLDRPDFVRLPVYNEIRASAGPGAAVPTSEHADGVVAFTSRFLRDQGAHPDHCSIIWARGDSMQPTIPDGSILIVDRSQTDVVNGCIYVLNVADDLLVKRVRRRLDATVEIVSDNSMYPPEALRADQLQQLRIVGRVVYFCRTP